MNGYRELFLCKQDHYNWNQLHAEALGTFPCKPKIFRKKVRKAIINGVK